MATGSLSELEPEHVVGRSGLCNLRLEGSFISAQHAAIRWSGQRWELRDLGSRNGTFLDGVQLRAGRSYEVRRGAVVAFGQPTDAWELEDDGPPLARLVGPAGEVLSVQDDLLAIPEPGNPQATIYRGPDGLWQLERPEAGGLTIENGATFDVGGVSWQFFCPAAVSPTTRLAQPRELRSLLLHFQVSRDEEDVHLKVEQDTETYDLGYRSHNYLLLTLARQRVTEHRIGLPPTSCGWMDQEQMLDGLRTSATQLNVDIFRIRRMFAGEPLLCSDAAHIIERRPRAKQMRIGTEKLTITTV